VMGTVVEMCSDDKGIVWPESIAPFKVHLIEIVGNEDVRKNAEELYTELVSRGIEVLWDDRDSRPGEKFAESDLMGIPLRIVVSEKTLQAGGIEVKRRGEEDAKVIPEREFFDTVLG